MIDLDKLEGVGLLVPNMSAPVVHHFGPGIYMREVRLDPGVVVGRAHKEAHQNIMLAGCLSLLTENGWQLIRAPFTSTGKPGRKVAIVHEPTVWINIYATTLTDIDVIEAQMFDDSQYMVEWRDAVMRFASARAQPDRDDYAEFVASSPWTADEVRALSERTDDQMPMPAPWSGMVKVCDSPIEGRGLFSLVPVAAGDVVAPARLGGRRTEAGRYINHSKTPNAVMVPNDKGDVIVVALRDIAGCHGGDTGEEITVDYRQAVNVARLP
jgi:hypothetical protein